MANETENESPGAFVRCFMANGATFVARQFGHRSEAQDYADMENLREQADPISAEFGVSRYEVFPKVETDAS